MVKESNSLRNRKLHSSKPYDVSNSFVKKVTSRVTNLLPQPAWLSKWFTSSADNGHDRDALNSNDSSSEEDKNLHASPAKRTKIALNQAYPPNSFQISPVITNSVSGQWAGTSRGTQNESASLDLEQAGPSGINTRQQLVSSTPNIQSSSTPQTMLAGAEHKMNGDDQSESSESTSGCSSLVPQANRQFEDGESVTNSLSARRRSMDEKLNFTGHLQSPRSLFSDRSRSPRLNSSLTRRRPSFNVSSFSSPILEKDKTSIKNRIVSSPFYSGRTMYGGASAYRKSKDGFFSSSETLSQKRCGVQVKPVNSASDTLSSMSTTARRILEALEQFSTPVLDAKRIPLEPSTPPLSGKRKRLYEPDFSPGLRSGQAPRTPNSAKSLTCGLTIPTVPDLLKMRHREKLQDSLEAARLIAVSSASNVVSSSASSSQDYKFGVDNSRRIGRHGGKIRSREKELEEESVEKVDLPNISLPVTSLPKFDFVVPPATSTPPVNSTFKFASPITVTKSARTCLPVENFTFSKPLSAKGDENSSVTKNVNCIDSSIPHCPTKSGNLQFISGSDKKLLLREKDNKNSLCKNNSQNSESCFGIKPATELKTGSVMDILNREPNSCNKEDFKDVSSSNSTLLEKFKPAQGTWECGACMIRNKSDAMRCAACETSRTSTETCSSKSSVAALPNKTSEDTWECSSCHVHNLCNASVCKKCSAARGEHAPSAPKVECKGKSASGFGNKFKPASDTWECGTCLVSNPDSFELCQACETKRPVLTTTSLPVLCPKPMPSLGFGDQFKKPKGSWDCPDCMLQNKEESLKCVACERAKPGTETKSSVKYNFTIPKEASNFKFGIDKAGENSSLTKSASSDMQGFKFGETKVTVAGNFSFGVPASVSNASKSDNVISGFSSGGSNFSLSTSCAMVQAADTSTLSHGNTSPHSSALSEEKEVNEVVPKKRRSSNACEAVVGEKGSKPKEKDNLDLIRASATSTENAVLDKKLDAKLDNKKVTFSFGTVPGTSNFTSEKPNFSTKTECAKPSFNFGTQPGSTTAGLNFGSVKAAALPSYSFIAPHSTSVGSVTSDNSTAAISTSAATAITSTASSFAASVCTTATSSPAVTNNALNVTSASASSPFTFGSSNVSPFRSSSGLNFGQSAVSTTASPLSFGTALKTTVTPVFNFNSNTSQTKPFSVSKEPNNTMTSKKQLSNFGLVTDTAPVAGFGPQTTTATITTTTVPSITSSSLPNFTSTTSTPSFTSGTRSTVAVFGTPNTSTSSTTTTAVGFGSVTTPNFSTGFSTPGEQKQPALPSETFSFGSNSNTNTPSLGQTPSFSFGAMQNDQTVKGFTFGTASGSTASATHAAPSGFGFAPNNQAPSQIGTSFNFGSNIATTSANSSLFGSVNNNTSAPAVFGAGSAVTPFGANTPSTTSTSFTVPTFNFGTSNSQPSSNLFVFAPNQTSGSTNLPVQNFTNPASTFNFNQAQSSVQNPTQPALPTFNPNVRPSFNFTKGETPLFTAAAGAAPAPGPQRRIKKAVRRTHQR